MPAIPIIAAVAPMVIGGVMEATRDHSAGQNRFKPEGFAGTGVRDKGAPPPAAPPGAGQQFTAPAALKMPGAPSPGVRPPMPPQMGPAPAAPGFMGQGPSVPKPPGPGGF